MNDKFADVIHIGFAKTGTTWLQSHVLGTDDRIACLGKPYLIDKAYHKLFDRMVSVNDYDFDPQEFRIAFKNLAEKNNAAFTGKLRVISYELFSGELFSGRDGYWIMKRLRDVFGDVRIVITVREQVSQIESLYRHYLKEGGSLHIREFLYKNRSPASDFFGVHHLYQKLRYDVVLKAYEDTFGEGNVKVVPYELLTHEGPDAYSEAFLRALGLDKTPSRSFPADRQNENFSYLGCNVIRFINQIICTPHSDSPLFRYAGLRYIKVVYRPFRTVDRKFLSRISANKKFTDKKVKWPFLRLAKKILGRHNSQLDDVTIRQDIRNAYATSNRTLQNKTGLDLKRLGYSVSDYD